MMTEVASTRRSIRSLAGLIAFVLFCAIVDGVIGLLVGLAILAWVLFARRTAALFAISVALFILVPVSMLLRGLPSTTGLSPLSAVDQGITNQMAFAAFAALCAGVLFEQVRESRAPASPRAIVATAREPSHVVQGSVWLVLGIAVQVLLNGGFAIAAARATDSNPLGNAYALTSVVLFIGYASGLGLGVTVTRFGTGRSSSSSLVFTWAVVLTTISSFIGALICVLAIHPSGGNLLGSDLTAVLVLGAVVTGTSIAFLVDIRLLAQRKAPLVLVRLTCVGLIRFPLLALRPGSIDPGLWVFVVVVVPSAYSGIVGLLVLPRLDGLRFQLRSRPPDLSEMIRIAGVDWLATLSAQAPLFALPVVVAVQVTPSANASFFLAWSAAAAAVTVPTAIAQVVLLEGGRREGGSPTQAQALEAIVLAVGICAALWALSAFFEPAVVATLGESFTPAARLLPTLLAGCVPAAVAAVLISEARLARDETAVIVTTLAAAVTLLGLAMVWVPSNGIDGAGRAWVIGNCVGGAVAVTATIRRRRRHRSTQDLPLAG
jgi:hypothetical protein